MEAVDAAGDDEELAASFLAMASLLLAAATLLSVGNRAVPRWEGGLDLRRGQQGLLRAVLGL